MLKYYSLIKKGDYYLLKRLIFPRCDFSVDLRRSIPQIKTIKFIDECSVKEMAKVINEIGSFLESFNPGTLNPGELF